MKRKPKPKPKPPKPYPLAQAVEKFLSGPRRKEPIYFIISEAEYQAAIKDAG